MKRPVNINLLKIKLPLTALLSITHRLSGMFVFFVVLPLTAISLYYLAESLDSYEQFSGLIESNFGLKFLFLSCLIIFKYHIFTGVRHMLMDFHLRRERINASHKSSQITLMLFLIDSILTVLVVL